MYRNTVNIVGLPAAVILLAIALVMMACGAVWIRRRVEIEPETHNFRATAPGQPNWFLRAGIALGFVAFGLALVAIALPR